MNGSGQLRAQGGFYWKKKVENLWFRQTGLEAYLKSVCKKRCSTTAPKGPISPPKRIFGVTTENLGITVTCRMYCQYFGLSEKNHVLCPHPHHHQPSSPSFITNKHHQEGQVTCRLSVALVRWAASDATVQ
ncbi:hypothetical protein E2C01_043741 [Portunus trituberculatus]|uniref:Uncharacterized protein n=1 Tax=Portunus trituberculatus TaxID=210409 RepID=A0A5B7FWH7_PORTR|nr:hypothetical protein [Portunus trituberculatus]